MRADARRNFDRLLEQARLAFVERGIDASLEDIARRAGVGIGTLYRHFPTRQDLVLAVVRTRMEALRVQAEQLLDAPDPEWAMVTWLTAYLRHASEFRGLADSMAEVVRGDERKRSACDGMHAAAGQLLARAQRAGLIRDDVDVLDLFAIIHAVAWATERCGARTGRAERTLDVMLRGLKAELQPGPAGR
jgi:AcrR family transcriptional regulator